MYYFIVKECRDIIHEKRDHHEDSSYLHHVDKVSEKPTVGLERKQIEKYTELLNIKMMDLYV